MGEKVRVDLENIGFLCPEGRRSFYALYYAYGKKDDGFDGWLHKVSDIAGDGDGYIDGEIEDLWVLCHECKKWFKIPSENHHSLARSNFIANMERCPECTKKWWRNNPLPQQIIYDQSIERLSYKEYLETPHWQAVRESSLRRGGHRCCLCGSQERLHVHHNTYKNKGHELPEDLCVLCEKHHQEYHDKHEEKSRINISYEEALLAVKEFCEKLGMLEP